MHFFELFGEISVWISILLGAGLVILLGIVSLLIRGEARKEAEGVSCGCEDDPVPDTGTEEGDMPTILHGRIPLVLKMLYLLFFAWALGYSFWVLLTGRAI